MSATWLHGDSEHLFSINIICLKLILRCLSSVFLPQFWNKKLANILFSLVFRRRQTSAVEVHLLALEKLQSEPCICSKLLLQSTLDTRHQMIFVGVLFHLDDITRKQGNPQLLFLFTTSILSDETLPHTCFPFWECYLKDDGAGITPASWWWPRSLLVMRSRSPLGMEREQQLCFRLLIRGHVPIQCFQAHQQPCSTLAIAADMPLSGGKRRDFIPQSGFM